ncbi:amidohydrolase family protein [Micromonospora echinospora]
MSPPPSTSDHQGPAVDRREAGGRPVPVGRALDPESDGLLLAGPRLATGGVVDVLLSGGRIAVVRPAGTPVAGGVPRLDLSGHLLLPAPAEPHSHFDKVLTGTVLGNRTGDLAGAVDAWYAYRRSVSRSDVRERALRAAYELLGNGATAIRTHVDVGVATGLGMLEALLEVREELAGQADLQVVAMVDRPVTGPDGAGNRAMLVEAVRSGADVIGAAPYSHPDPPNCLRLLLDVAADFGRPVDLHTDETLDPAVDTLSELAELVLATGFRPAVTASHCVSLGVRGEKATRAVVDRVTAAGIGVITCPSTNLFLQGRGHGHSVPRGLTAIRALRAAGVAVAGAGDNMRDPFNPVGRGDPLETASLLVTAGHLNPAEAYDAVSAQARTVMGLPVVRIEAGAPAELLAIRAQSLTDAIATANMDRMVIHRGRLVSRTRVERTFSPPLPAAARR